MYINKFLCILTIFMLGKDIVKSFYYFYREFSCSSVSKESACNSGDLGSIPGSGRSPGEENDNPLQYSCLENPMDQRSLAGYSLGGHKSQTRLSN